MTTLGLNTRARRSRVGRKNANPGCPLCAKLARVRPGDLLVSQDRQTRRETHGL
jgi:hypothetical protein